MTSFPKIVVVLWACTIILLCSCLWFVLSTIHWPLTGDAALMHYIVFLMDHGFAPYRDIGDINLPGAYLPNWLVIHMFGVSALAWRLYDFALLIFAGLAMVAVAVQFSVSWHAGIWAASLFALIHGRDGLDQLGQRDLTVAVLLLLSTATLLRWSPNKPTFWAAFLFGAGVASAALIKPTAAPFLLLAAPMLWQRYRLRLQPLRHAVSIAVGFLVPVSATVVWLLRWRSLPAFLHIERTLTPYHASMGRHPISSMLPHSLSPILPLVVLWVLLLVTQASWRGTTAPPVAKPLLRSTLLLGAALGLVAYITQGRDYPYHRYPFLSFLLVLMAIDLYRLLSRRDLLGWVGGAVLVASVLFLGGTSAFVASRYAWRQQEFRSTLEADLTQTTHRLGLRTLSHHIQCLDSVFGCVATLNEMQLLTCSGQLYDEFLFHPPGLVAVDESRTRFWHSIQAEPPLVFVVTEPLFPTGPDHYRKLDQWPAFEAWMAQNYTLSVERPSMHRVRHGGAAYQPPGYRLYIRRNVPLLSATIPFR